MTGKLRAFSYPRVCEHLKTSHDHNLTARRGVRAYTEFLIATFTATPMEPVARPVLIGRSSQSLEEVEALTDLPVDIVATDTLGETWAETGALGAAWPRLRQPGSTP